MILVSKGIFVTGVVACIRVFVVAAGAVAVGMISAVALVMGVLLLVVASVGRGIVRGLEGELRAEGM